MEMNEFQNKYKAEITELVEACHRCAELNYVTSSGGNLSLRVEERSLLITPTKTLKRKMKFEDICAVDLDGNVIYAPEGKKPTGEWPFHTAIMKKRKDVKAIVHAHPPILTGFAIANNGILEQAFLPEPIIEVGPLIMVEYATPLSQELSEHFEKVVDLSNGFLMENHGAVFLSGVGIEDAVEILQMSECMAESVLVGHLLGNAKPLTEKNVRDMNDVLQERNLKIPGEPGKYVSVEDLYKTKKELGGKR